MSSFAYHILRAFLDRECSLLSSDRERCEVTVQVHITVTHTRSHYHFCTTKKNSKPCLAQADSLCAAYRRVLLSVYCCVPLQDCSTGKGNRIWLEHHLLANPSCWVLMAPCHKASLFYVKNQAGPRMARSHRSWKTIFPSPSSLQSTAMRP